MSIHGSRYKTGSGLIVRKKRKNIPKSKNKRIVSDILDTTLSLELNDFIKDIIDDKLITLYMRISANILVVIRNQVIMEQR